MRDGYDRNRRQGTQAQCLGALVTPLFSGRDVLVMPALPLDPHAAVPHIDVAMRPHADGWWTAVARLAPGEYTFRYDAAGEWYADYAAHGVERDAAGGWHSLLVVPEAPAGFTLPETLDDFSVADLEPEAFGYRMLRRQMQALQAKGVDTSESWVDLHLKLALPAAAVIMVLVGVPLAVRGASTKSLPAAIAMGFAIGFSYFMLVGFARALGQSGALPPLVAAWAANGIFLLLGGYLVLGAD